MTRKEMETVEKHFDELYAIAIGITPNIPDDIRDALKASYLAGADYAIDMFAPRWISVEDELPKEWERVLCHGYDKRSKLGHGLIFVTCRVNKNNYSNYSLDGNGFVVDVPAPFKRVTHWMPTPQPPSSSEKPNNFKKGGEL